MEKRSTLWYSGPACITRSETDPYRKYHRLLRSILQDARYARAYS